MPNRLVDAQSRPIRLAREIASGGEGRIVDVAGSPNQVAKLYHPGSLPADPEKLLCMVSARSDLLLEVAAWPINTLHESSAAGPLVGFLMPRISGYQQIHGLYAPEDRLKSFPDADWRFLARAAMNCAASFETVHRHGSLIADVNQKNILVAADASVILVDCDSFQVRTAQGRVFRCGVGVPEFTPPELQGRCYADVDREENHDRFGLAVLIFHLLFMGRHPFSGVNRGSANIPLEQAIRESRFAYSRNNTTRSSAPPPGVPTLDAIPFSLAVLFERAFAAPGTNTDRPSAAEWQSALSLFRDQLRPCRTIPTHYYHPVTKRCHWCVLTRRHRVTYFRQIAVPKKQARPVGPILRAIAYQIVIALLLCAAGVFAVEHGRSAVLVFRFDHILRESARGDATARQEARAKLRGFGPSAIHTLVKQLNVEDPLVSLAAEEALNEIDPNWPAAEGTKRALPELAEKLGSEYTAEILRTIKTLRRIGPAAAPAAPKLIAWLLQNDHTYREDRIAQIQQLALEALQGVDANWLSSNECEQVMAQLIGQLGRSRHGIDTVPYATDPSETRVISVLVMLAPASRAAVPELIKSLVSFNRDARESARAALDRIDPNWRVSPEARECIPWLIALWRRAFDPVLDWQFATPTLDQIEPDWREKRFLNVTNHGRGTTRRPLIDQRRTNSHAR